MHAALCFSSRVLCTTGIATILLAAACTDSLGPGNPVRLGFSLQPGGITAGAPFPVEVEVLNTEGSRVLSATPLITLSLGGNSTGATLSGTIAANAVEGVAHFPAVIINKTGAGYTLVATAPNLTEATSATFTVGIGPPAKLAFLVQPTATTAAVPITPAVSVAVQDLGGNTVPDATPTVTIVLGTGTGTLSGTTSVAAVGGVATFSDLRIDKVGTGYLLRASSAGLSDAFSSVFAVSAGPPAKLAFTRQPPGAPDQSPLNPGPIVAVQDAGGNPVTNATNAITITLGANPSGATLSGTTSVGASSGVATFSNLIVSLPGAGYTLIASAATLTSATSAPFTIRPSLGFTSISAGYFHSCGRATDNLVYCWGAGGTLGDGSQTQSFGPVPVTGGAAFQSVSAGRDNTCGLTAAGAAWCWGFNFSGELGDGTTANQTTPSPVTGGHSFAAVVAGYNHACGVTPGGAAYCWGGNLSGELGIGTTVNISPAPALVTGGLTWSQVSPGRIFTCGVTVGNAAYCWGSNTNGNLGNGTSVSSNVPVLVLGGLSFATVGAGGFHACGLTVTGAAYCWGSGSFGELGAGPVTSSSTPVLVSGSLVFTSLSVGNRHNCGLVAGGVAYCWGDNGDGRLGDGSTTSRSVPTLVAGGLTFSNISAGRFNTCGVTTDNLGYCWGAGFGGQSGLGVPTFTTVPVRVR